MGITVDPGITPDLCVSFRPTCRSGTRSGTPLVWTRLLLHLPLVDTALEQELKETSSQSCILVWHVPGTSNQGWERKEGHFGRR